MDPTNDPNFTPPSRQPLIEPTAPSSAIPKFAPIQPLVLADMGDPVDAPSPHPQISSNASAIHLHHHVKDKLYQSKIPRIHGDLVDSSSDDEKKDEPANGVSDVTQAVASFSIEEVELKQQPQQPGPSVIFPPNLQVQLSQIADLEEVPHGIQRQAKTLEEYHFPTHRLATTMLDDSKHPLVIVACGSFSPITYLHLRMFEMALDAILEQTRFEVIGGYYSPVSSNYKKQGLAPAHHRVRMCELACERTSSWLMVDAWESLQPRYMRTALVLDHFNQEINVKRGGITTKNGEKRLVKIMLLAGGDLIESMGEPDVWADLDLHHILGKYGCLIVERTGSDVRLFLLSHDIMYEHRRNILVIKQLIYNDISLTKIRLFIRRGMSVQYLLPNSVIRYIQKHNLYIGSEPVKQVMSEKAD